MSVWWCDQCGGLVGPDGPRHILDFGHHVRRVSLPPQPQPIVTVTHTGLTEDDVRRIVREELKDAQK